MLAEFFDWWTQQLRDLLDGGADAQPGRVLVLTPEAAGGAVVALRRRGQERVLGHLPPGPDAAAALRGLLDRHARLRGSVLRLPVGALLERSVTLPLAAERDLARLLGYEMDRLTPFRAAEVCFTATVEQRDRGRNQLRARLLLVPLATVAPLLTLLSEAGAPAPALEAPDAAGTTRTIPVGAATAPRGRRLAPALGVLCAVLAITAAGLPFARQVARAASVERRIAALRPRVALAEALRRRIASADLRGGALAAQRARAGDVLAVLASVTDRLPDGTFLTGLTLRQGRLSLRGQSLSAAPLIASLAASPMLRDPAFAAPVTRAPRGGADLFSITAQVATAPVAP